MTLNKSNVLLQVPRLSTAMVTHLVLTARQLIQLFIRRHQDKQERHRLEDLNINLGHHILTRHRRRHQTTVKVEVLVIFCHQSNDSKNHFFILFFNFLI